VLGARGWGMVSSCLAGLAAGRWPLVAAGLKQIKSGGQVFKLTPRLCLIYQEAYSG
jgi:hypothetical protein